MTEHFYREQLCSKWLQLNTCVSYWLNNVTPVLKHLNFTMQRTCVEASAFVMFIHSFIQLFP